MAVERSWELTLVKMLLQEVEVAGDEADFELEQMQRVGFTGDGPCCWRVVSFFDGVVMARKQWGAQDRVKDQHKREEKGARDHDEKREARGLLWEGRGSGRGSEGGKGAVETKTNKQQASCTRQAGLSSE